VVRVLSLSLFVFVFLFVLLIDLTGSASDWTLERHLLFPVQFRRAVFTLFLIHQEHRNLDTQFGLVPLEMLLEIISHLAHDPELQWFKLQQSTPEYQIMATINACSSASVEKLTTLLQSELALEIINTELDYLTPLVAAARNNHEQVVALLIKHQADIDYVCGNGAYALREACRYRHTKVVNQLLAARADPLITHGGESLLEYCEGDLVQVVRDAIAQRQSSNSTSTNGGSPSGSGRSSAGSRKRLLHQQCVIC